MASDIEMDYHEWLWTLSGCFYGQSWSS